MQDNELVYLETAALNGKTKTDYSCLVAGPVGIGTTSGGILGALGGWTAGMAAATPPAPCGPTQVTYALIGGGIGIGAVFAGLGLCGIGYLGYLCKNTFFSPPNDGPGVTQAPNRPDSGEIAVTQMTKSGG